MCNANLSDANWALIFAFLRTHAARQGSAKREAGSPR